MTPRPDVAVLQTVFGPPSCLYVCCSLLNGAFTRGQEQQYNCYNRRISHTGFVKQQTEHGPCTRE